MGCSGRLEASKLEILIGLSFLGGFDELVACIYVIPCSCLYIILELLQ